MSSLMQQQEKMADRPLYIHLDLLPHHYLATKVDIRGIITVVMPHTKSKYSRLCFSSLVVAYPTASMYAVRYSIMLCHTG